MKIICINGGKSEQENGKTHAVGVGREKVSKKTHLGRLSCSPRAESGLGSRKVERKNRDVGVVNEKYARKPKKKTSRNSPRKLMKKVSGVNLFIAKL